MSVHSAATKTRSDTMNRPSTTGVIEPCRDADQFREYIDAHWRAGHVLARDEAMFRFTYQTPWVDRSIFPGGVSVLCIYDEEGASLTGETPASPGRMLGFLGAIVAPYPRPQSYWLALWHVLPELKGTGMGGRLLAAMQKIALPNSGGGIGKVGEGWIGTFGAGPEALPVYLKRGYAARAARRWIYEPGPPPESGSAPMHSTESLPTEDWLDYRYRQHPMFIYDRRTGGVFRTETNEWGVVTHCCRLTPDWFEDVNAVYDLGRCEAETAGRGYLMDAWSFNCPGPGWTLAPDDLPSVFHPPEARGNITYAVGMPFLPCNVHKGDCDQDRPN